MTPEALQVLRSLAHLPAHDGKKPRPAGLLINNGEQLDRAVYLEVAAVLEQCGAKWHKGHKIHVFGPQWDPGMLEDICETGEAPPKNPLAYFPTPDVISDEIAAFCDRCVQGVYIEGELYAARVLEPSAGTGALVDAFLRRIEAIGFTGETESSTPCLEIVLVEVDQRRARILERKYKNPPAGIAIRVVCEDFMKFAKCEQESGGRFDAILANPPFSLKGDREAWRTHLLACASLLDERGRMGIVVPGNYKQHAMKPDLELLDILGAAEKRAYPKGTFEGTAIATAGIFVHGDYLSERTFNGSSIWVENTDETMQKLRAVNRQHGFSVMSKPVRDAMIVALADAAIEGNERVLFDDDSLESMRSHLYEQFQLEVS